MSLAVRLRPKSLKDVISPVVSEITNVLKRNNNERPHFYILTGEPGTGKTTIARILSYLLQWNYSKDCDIMNIEIPSKIINVFEINASSDNGIDIIRDHIEKNNFTPIKRYRDDVEMSYQQSKIVIWDEAHQLTSSSQNALLTEVEQLPLHIYYIFCTSRPTKLSIALRRRAYIIHMENLNKDNIKSLLKRSCDLSEENLRPLISQLNDNGIGSPGLILQALEKFLSSGTSISNEEEKESSAIDLCRAVVKSDWNSAKKLLNVITKEQVISTRHILLNYLKKVLLNSDNKVEILKMANSIKIISTNIYDDNLALFCADISYSIQK